MESVQVIDNHKGKFELNFDRVRDPVININTKKKFKGVLKAELAGGYGFGNRYDGSAKGFFFSDKFNSFATGQINNYGSKVFSRNDLTTAYGTKMTPAADDQLLLFSALNEQARKNIFNGNDFAFRAESDQSKTGLQVGGGWLNLEIEQTENTFLSDTLIRSTQYNDKQSGKYLSAALDHTAKLTPNFVLSNKTNFLYTTLKNSIFSRDSIFSPITTSFSELTDEAPFSFVIQNSTRLSKIINGNWLFRVKVNLYHEEIEDFLSSKVVNISSNAVSQNILSKKDEATLVSELQRSFKNASLSFGLNVTLGSEKVESNFPQEDFTDDSVIRKIGEYGLKSVYEGNLGKLDYSFSATPTLIRLNGGSVNHFLKTSNRLTYRIQQQNFLALNFSRSFDFQRINKLLSLTANSVNSIVKNEMPTPANLTVNNQLSLGWSNRNLARSRIYSINYFYNQNKNDIQTVFDRIEHSRLIYVNRQVTSSVSHSLSLGAEKGIFIGKRLSKLDFIGGLDMSISRYPTLVDGAEVNADFMYFQPNLEVRYTPRKKYVREVSNTIKRGHQCFTIDGTLASFQTSVINTFSVRGGRKKTSLDFNFIIEKIFLGQEDFIIPDINFTSSYELMDNLSLSLNANRLLTLFDLNNFNSVQTFSEGNLVIQSFNSDNLSYLILNVSCKL